MNTSETQDRKIYPATKNDLKLGLYVHPISYDDIPADVFRCLYQNNQIAYYLWENIQNKYNC